MQKIADTADSSLVFVDDATMLPAIAGALGAQFSVVARDVKIYAAVSQDVAVRNVTPGSGIKATSLPGSQVLEFQGNTLFVGESRDIVVKFSVPETISDEVCLFTVGVVYTNIYGEHCSFMPSHLVGASDLNLPSTYDALISCVQANDHKAPLIRAMSTKPSSNPAISAALDAQLQRCHVSAHLERALAWADARNFKASIDEIDDIRRRLATSYSAHQKFPLVLKLLDDLLLVSKNVSSEELYFVSGGQSLAMSLHRVCCSQRCVFNPDVLKLLASYQTLASGVMQQSSLDKL